ncbi:MAG: hypothetical protein ACREAW_09850 [Nitrososphaera sp.]
MGHIGDDSVIGSFRSSVPEIITNGTPAAGKQATLSLVIANDVDHTQQFVELVEVRDSDGVTVFLAWQSGLATMLQERLQ